jgi:hypothetical protein
MSTDRKKLELELNQPMTLELIFDRPLQGENRYGPYFLYALQDPETGTEYSYFAPPEVHEHLKDLTRGDVFTITKTATTKGKKIVTDYHVEIHTEAAQDVSFPPPATNGNGKATAVMAKPMASPVRTSVDAFFDAMLASYEDAMRIQEKLNGMVDVNRIAITLFIARSKGPGSAFVS